MTKFNVQIVLNFLKKLVSNDESVSSKRVVGLLSFVLVVEIVNAVLWWHRSIPEFIFYGIIALITACFGLNAMIDLKSLGSKTINKDSSSEATEETKDSSEDKK